jgi:Bacterial Ig-like domain (group 1)
MRLISIFASGLLAVLLVACGSGGGSPGSVSNSTIGTSSPTTSTTITINPNTSVATFAVSLEKSSIANNGIDQSKITVTALDSANNIVPGVTVKVSTDNNSIFIPPTSPLTDSSGGYTGVIKSAAEDKSDRVVNAIVTVNGLRKTVGLQIKGSQLVVTVVPAVALPGSTVTLTAIAKDSGGSPISGVSVDVSGALATNLTTDSNGIASTIFAVPSAPGTYNVNASGSGVQAVSSLVVTSGSGGGGIPAAVIPAGVSPSFAINPTVLAPNSVGSSANQSNFRFLILDPSNSPIPNVRVRFEPFGAGLGYDGVITSGANSVPTNASGIATSAYISGTQSSPTNGVTFRACYKATDFTGPNDCPQFVFSNMTVAGSAVAISIGDDNALQKEVGTYIQRFAVSVVDSAGRAVPGAPVAYSVDITHYGKGQYSQDITLSTSTPQIGFAIPDLSTPPLIFGRRVSCPNEDANRNGSIDPSEDINGNNVLDPKPSDVVIAPDVAGVTTTDSSGIIRLKVTWLQKVATWVVYRVKVTTNVGGSQSVAESSFPTYFVVGDDANAAPFKVPPYGIGACNQAN